MFVQRGLSTGVVLAIVGLLILLGGGVLVMNSSKGAQDAMKSGDAMVSDEKMEGDAMMEDSHMEGEAMMEKEGDAMMKKDGESMESTSGDAMMEKKEDGAMMESSSVEGATPLALTGTKLAGSASPLLIFNEADYNAALKSSNTVLLWYYAEWCPTCKLEQKDVIAAFNEFTKPGVVGFRVNINDNDTSRAEEQTARDYGVAFRHTKVAIKEGERVLKTTEVWKKEHYLENLNNFIN